MRFFEAFSQAKIPFNLTGHRQITEIPIPHNQGERWQVKITSKMHHAHCTHGLYAMQSLRSLIKQILQMYRRKAIINDCRMECILLYVYIVCNTMAVARDVCSFVGVLFNFEPFPISFAFSIFLLFFSLLLLFLELLLILLLLFL